MKDILPIPMQIIENESVSSYALHAGASTNYILISIFRYLLDFTSLQVKVINNFKYMKMNIFKQNIDQHHVYFRSGIMVYSNTCNL